MFGNAQMYGPTVGLSLLSALPVVYYWCPFFLHAFSLLGKQGGGETRGRDGAWSLNVSISGVLNF